MKTYTSDLKYKNNNNNLVCESAGHPPAHLEGRVGEADNPGPLNIPQGNYKKKTFAQMFGDADWDEIKAWLQPKMLFNNRNIKLEVAKKLLYTSR